MKHGPTLLLFLAACVMPALAAAESGQAGTTAESSSRALADIPGNSHEFYFTRGIYSGEFDDYDEGGRWAIDYPKADHQFLIALKRLSIIDAYELYAVEVGSMSLTEKEVLALRNYLLAGGFLVIDDFWGSWAWEQFANQMQRVFPDRAIVEIPLDHPVFNAFYNIDRIIQVPNVRQGWGAPGGGPTHEYDGFVPHVRGIFDDDGRLMVLINWNTDLGDAWEWADDSAYPLKFSTYAFEIGINFVIYAMTH
jgi:hypothetical protein